MVLRNMAGAETGADPGAGMEGTTGDLPGTKLETRTHDRLLCLGDDDGDADQMDTSPLYAWGPARHWPPRDGGWGRGDHR